MINYLIRRLLYLIPILIGVNLITFLLFFAVNSPTDMARAQLGQKHVSEQAVKQWVVAHGYDKPLFYNSKDQGVMKVADTLFVKKSLELFTFDFGRSTQGRQIGQDIKQRLWPSLALAVPTLFIGLVVNISIAMMLALFRASYIDSLGVIICTVLMSISGLFYIIGGQYVIGKLLLLVPISGYQSGLSAIKFLILPVIIGVLSGLGGGVRWYRTLFLEQLGKPYVVTARAKGLGLSRVLFRHVLKNAMIPILTGVVVILPMLFFGSLIMESFFGIPGLGSYTIDAIQQQDFEIVRVMVFLGTIFYMIGLMLTDMAYAWVDPRVRFNQR